ncbi:MAG: UvrD-helicase domain-containing protein [Coriobacteriales bacterium]|jgi:DNA helicase-2/ATP-dependent DNA helicase PcrA|nr:UvrD-helicase domain-containing protein [Coriobacteriales bacterium]
MAVDLSSLNTEQRRAVETTEGPLLVLAGAGSGKTRVLTYRIAHLIEDIGVSPYQILAITFTNKAAAEMRERLSELLAGGLRGMWVQTFHAMCVRLLRQDATLLGYTRNFSIYDEDDSKRLFKELYAQANVDPRQFPINRIRASISQAKNELLTPDAYEAQADNAYTRLVARLYQALQARLRQSDAMDFDDLLLNAWLLLRDNPEVLGAYQRRFQYLLVDEYQDTNHAQYRICTLLAAATRNLMVVGDDDQSIYSWRGADIRNILEFEQDYPDARVVRLERNYRSTATILDAANALIANNANRKSKRLYTEGSKGEQIALYQAADERDEGRWIASEVERLHREGRAYRQFAVFYRTNAQSRVLEDKLLRAGVPYRIVGGTRFFDRAEIRDVMAYLKLVVNPRDDIAARRILNVPKRGLGKKAESDILARAWDDGVSFLEAAELVCAEDSLSRRARDELARFCQLIKDARGYRGDLRSIVEMLVERSGLIAALEAEHNDEARGRIENIQEFFGVTQEYDEIHTEDEVDELEDDPSSADETSILAPAFVDTVDNPTELGEPGDIGDPAPGLADPADPAPGLVDTTSDPADPAPGLVDATSDLASDAPAPQLIAFMEWLALRSDLDSLLAGEDYLTLMTIHSAKGLEFPVVFIAGLEESLFPHVAAFEAESGVEEERRLAYVAITRARELLFVTHAQTRNLFGRTQTNPRSRFVAEIPVTLLKISGVGSQSYRGFGWEKRGDRQGTFGSGSRKELGESRVFGSSGTTNDTANAEREAMRNIRESLIFSVGDEIDHKTFGRGVVLAVDGEAITIEFHKSGSTKKLLLGYAPLVKIGE